MAKGAYTKPINKPVIVTTKALPVRVSDELHDQLVGLKEEARAKGREFDLSAAVEKNLRRMAAAVQKELNAVVVETETEVAETEAEAEAAEVVEATEVVTEVAKEETASVITDYSSNNSSYTKRW